LFCSGIEVSFLNEREDSNIEDDEPIQTKETWWG